jgi:hypothetical protein
MAKLDGQFDDADSEADTSTPGFKVTVLPTPSPLGSNTKKAVPLPAPKAKKVQHSNEYGFEDDDDDYDDDDDDYDDDFHEQGGERGRVEVGGELGSALEKNLMSGKMNISQRLTNEISNSDSVAGKRGANYTGRDDRATSEQVMDPRTRLMLFKLLNSGFLSEIDGCLSTGKEANVYYAKAGSKASSNPNAGSFTEYAIKVFKTSILVFKDRDK